MQGGVGSSGRRNGGLCASHSASWVCWAGFEDLRPKAASPRGTPREGSDSLSPCCILHFIGILAKCLRHTVSSIFHWIMDSPISLIIFFLLHVFPLLLISRMRYKFAGLLAINPRHFHDRFWPLAISVFCFSRSTITLWLYSVAYPVSWNPIGKYSWQMLPGCREACHRCVVIVVCAFGFFFLRSGSSTCSLPFLDAYCVI